jgi:hypothetical protein
MRVWSHLTFNIQILKLLSQTGGEDVELHFGFGCSPGFIDGKGLLGFGLAPLFELIY